MTFNTWHFCIQGFMQHSYGNGITRLFDHLADKLSGHPEHRIELLEYNDNLWNTAERVARYCRDNGIVSPVINIYCYSWGGAAAARLCKLFRDRGIVVNMVVMADPVYRYTSALKSLQVLGLALTLVRWVPIRIVNVRHPVWWSRQFENWPCAHEVVSGDAGTVILPPVIETATHQNMEDLPSFLGASLDAAMATVEVR